jgi:hypothetical protein
MLAERNVAHNWTKVLGVADKVQRGWHLGTKNGSDVTFPPISTRGRWASESNTNHFGIIPIVPSHAPTHALRYPRNLGNEEGIVCSLCNAAFILTTRDAEWNKLAEWRRLAAMAVRDSHKLRHEQFPLELVWKMKHKR